MPDLIISPKKPWTNGSRSIPDECKHENAFLKDTDLDRMMPEVITTNKTTIRMPRVVI